VYILNSWSKNSFTASQALGKDGKRIVQSGKVKRNKSDKTQLIMMQIN